MTPLAFSLQSLLLIIFYIAFRRSKDLSVHLLFPKYSAINWLFFFVPVSFPLLSIMGAVSLNNGGPNFFTLLMLGLVALYVTLLTVYRRRLNPHLYPYSVYFISLALLLMTSLRGWYTTGHDNQQEFYVYQLTQSHFLWSMSWFRDTYNACLSLNILPTVFNSFLHIPDVYIFKVVFQLLFPFAVIGVYLFLKKFATKKIAYLSTFFFISFPTFANDMPMLNRQEIALIFFSLLLLVLFHRRLSWGTKNIIFLIFAAGLVVSHYTTSYIATALFLITFLLSFITRKFNRFRRPYFLTPVMVIGLAFFTFFWNAALTKTTAGLTSVVAETWQNIGRSFSRDLKSSDVGYSLFNWRRTDNLRLFNDYVALQNDSIAAGPYQNLYFPQNIYQNYPVIYTPDATQPLTAFGRSLKTIFLDPYWLNNLYKQGSAKLIQLLLVVGFIFILSKSSPYLKSFPPEFYLLSFISISLLGLFIILPFISREYGTLRFFQQTLTLLALPTIVGCLTVFGFLKGRFPLYATLSFFLIFFLSLYGFIPQL